MSQDKMKITIADQEAISEFIKTVIIGPMNKGITGNVTIHYLNGEIRGCEVNCMTRKLNDIKTILGE
jgi:hypothetical protein